MSPQEEPRLSLAILDIDGTLLDTPHLAAWRIGLAVVLGHDGTGHPAQDDALLSLDAYQRRVAGRPREAGARAALEQACGRATPDLVAELVRVKQEEFRGLAGTTTLFDDAERFLARAARRELPLAFCTASRNAGGVLRDLAATLPYGDWLVERLDRSLGQAGHRGDHPRPESLRAVAEVWGRDPRECVVIDDAPHGVTAARTAGMEAVLVHRFSYSPSVAADDVVVGSLDALELDHRLAVTTHA